jgi:hypothetical protein
MSLTTPTADGFDGVPWWWWWALVVAYGLWAAGVGAVEATRYGGVTRTLSACGTFFALSPPESPQSRNASRSAHRAGIW